jgi:Ribbon-helix-helix protein, copG family
MAKRKTTLYVDEDVLRAAKVMAARKGKRDSEIFEEALRKYVGFAVIDRIRARNTDLTPEEAERLASEAVHESRR